MQTVPQSFHDTAQQGIRPHTWGFRASFTKEFDDTITFFILNTSILDGPDLLGPSDDNPIQQWDFYEYSDYTDRIVDMEWSREIEFPYSVSAAIADFTLNNYDNYFTPGKGSPIDGYILPKRPIRLFAGFQGQSLLQQFVGITQRMPVLDSKTKVAQFHALDFLSEMFAMKLTNVIAMADVTTDEVLSEIFQQFGLSPTQYVLATGRNKIPFVFFDKDKNAGNAFRELMQSEGGALWIDEQGIIRFEQRLLPVETVAMEFNDSNVEEIEGSGDSEIINTVRITSDVRSVQEFQPVYNSTDPETGQSLIEPIQIPASGTAFHNADLSDPLLSVSTPTIGQLTDDSWFTATDLDGNAVTTDISITLTNLNNNNYVMLFENDNAFPVLITAIEVWGEPAKIIDQIRYEAYDEDSVTAYGEQVLEINNNLFGSESNCESFALTIIDAYKDFNGVIEMSVKGDPSLQLGDIVSVDTRDIVGQYKVIKLGETRRNSRATSIVRARKYVPREWFFLDISVLNGTDVLAP